MTLGEWDVHAVTTLGGSLRKTSRRRPCVPLGQRPDGASKFASPQASEERGGEQRAVARMECGEHVCDFVETEVVLRWLTFDEPPSTRMPREPCCRYDTYWTVSK
jgi:hypothetical protein